MFLIFKFAVFDSLTTITESRHMQETFPTSSDNLSFKWEKSEGNMFPSGR